MGEEVWRIIYTEEYQPRAEEPRTPTTPATPTARPSPAPTYRETTRAAPHTPSSTSKGKVKTGTYEELVGGGVGDIMATLGMKNIGAMVKEMPKLAKTMFPTMMHYYNKYQSGSEAVSGTGPALIHKGEAIIPEEINKYFGHESLSLLRELRESMEEQRRQGSTDEMLDIMGKGLGFAKEGGKLGWNVTKGVGGLLGKLIPSFQYGAEAFDPETYGGGMNIHVPPSWPKGRRQRIPPISEAGESITAKMWREQKAATSMEKAYGTAGMGMEMAGIAGVFGGTARDVSAAARAAKQAEYMKTQTGEGAATLIPRMAEASMFYSGAKTMGPAEYPESMFEIQREMGRAPIDPTWKQLSSQEPFVTTRKAGLVPPPLSGEDWGKMVPGTSMGMGFEGTDKELETIGRRPPPKKGILGKMAGIFKRGEEEKAGAEAAGGAGGMGGAKGAAVLGGAFAMANKGIEAIVGMLKKSKIFTTVMDNFLTIISAFVDIMLIPIMPFMMLVMKGLVKLLPGFMKVSQALETFLKDPAKGFKDLISSVGDLGGMITDFVVGIIAALPDIINAIITMLPMIITAIVTALPQIITAIMDALPSIIDTLAQAIPEIINTMILAVPQIITSFIQGLPQIIVSLINAIPTIITGLLSQLPQIITSFIELIPTIIDTIVTALPQVVNAIITAIPVIITAVVTAIPQIITSIVTSIPKVILSIITAIPQIINTLVAAIPKLITVILQALPQIITATISSIPIIIRTIVTAIPQIIGATISSIPQIVMALVRAVPQIISAIVKEVPNIAKAIWEAVKKAFSGLGQIIKDAFSSLGKKLNPLNWFQEGSNYIRETGPAVLHKGEAVIPAEVNDMFRGGALSFLKELSYGREQMPKLQSGTNYFNPSGGTVTNKNESYSREMVKTIQNIDRRITMNNVYNITGVQAPERVSKNITDTLDTQVKNSWMKVW